MNFPAEFTKDLYNFPLEKVDKMQDYLNELTSKVDSNQSNNAQTVKYLKYRKDLSLYMDFYI